MKITNRTADILAKLNFESITDVQKIAMGDDPVLSILALQLANEIFKIDAMETEVEQDLQSLLFHTNKFHETWSSDAKASTQWIGSTARSLEEKYGKMQSAYATALNLASIIRTGLDK